ncbi:hypothetical protein HanIR_Chr10g0460031 [Helianthus annuus]|nr:hypothetical protein HanIR_Chr10g0460031 [Helianthus annuus]
MYFVSFSSSSPKEAPLFPSTIKASVRRKKKKKFQNALIAFFFSQFYYYITCILRGQTTISISNSDTL